MVTQAMPTSGDNVTQSMPTSGDNVTQTMPTPGPNPPKDPRDARKLKVGCALQLRSHNLNYDYFALWRGPRITSPPLPRYVVRGD